MKKSVVFVLATISILALGIALIPNVHSQIEDVQILSYSMYVNPYNTDYLIVVGEVQNTGTTTLDYVIVSGAFFATDGTILMYNYVKTLTTEILPQQKAPFYLSFSSYDSITSDYSWWGTQENFTLAVGYAGSTGSSQYQGLEVTSHSASTDAYGYYMVTGTVKNTGSQSTNQTWVVGTFYNSTGDVIAVGYSEYLTPTSIAPGGTASFTIYLVDYTEAVNSIASYSLLIQTKLTAPSATPTPSPSPSPSPTSTASSSPTPTSTSTPTSTPTSSVPATGTTIPDTYLYIAAVAVAIVVVGVVAFVLGKRASKRTTVSQATEQDKGTEPPPQ